MTVSCFCPACKVPHHFLGMLFGKRVQCKNCRKFFVAGQPEKGAEEAPAEAPPAEELVAVGPPKAMPPPIGDGYRPRQGRWEDGDRATSRIGARQYPVEERSSLPLILWLSCGVGIPLAIGLVVLLVTLDNRGPQNPPPLVAVQPVQPPNAQAPQLPDPDPIPPLLNPDLKPDPKPKVDDPFPPAKPIDPVVPVPGKLERVLILLDPSKPAKEIAKLRFNGVPVDKDSYQVQVSNVLAVEGPAPPEGIYFNHRFSLNWAKGGSTGGIGLPNRGPLCTQQVPANTEITNIRQVGTCKADTRRGKYAYSQVTFLVLEGVYSR